MHLGGFIDHYTIYRATLTQLPDVAPPAEGTAVNTTDSGAAGSSVYYLVVPVAGTGVPQPASNRVGVFTFALAAGSQ